MRRSEFLKRKEKLTKRLERICGLIADRDVRSALETDRDASELITFNFYQACEIGIGTARKLRKKLKNGLKGVDSIESLFVKLGEAKIIDGQLANKLSGMVKVRNLIAHEYEDFIDIKELADAIMDVGRWLDFMEAIQGYESFGEE